MRLLYVIAGAILIAPTYAVEPSVPTELNERTFPAIREHIVPSAEECAFERIHWRTTFGAGVIEADRLEKPLLVWVMNGHPLGCT